MGNPEIEKQIQSDCTKGSRQCNFCINTAVFLFIVFALPLAVVISVKMKYANTEQHMASTTQISSDRYLTKKIYRVGHDNSFNWVFTMNDQVFSVSDEKLRPVIDSGCKNPRLGFVDDGNYGLESAIFFPPDYPVKNITIVWIHEKKTVIEIIYPAQDLFNNSKNSKNMERVVPSETI